MGVEVAMQWNTSYVTSLHTFANTINTREGGTHEEGFRAALTTTINKWGENWGLIKKREDRVSNDDIREGLTAIVSVKLVNPQFEGQTKTRLGNTEARGFVQRAVNAVSYTHLDVYKRQGLMGRIVHWTLRTVTRWQHSCTATATSGSNHPNKQTS